MSLFKKNIKFSQYIADLIKFQFNYIEQNYNKFIDLDDEYKALTLKDKEKLRSIVDDLILADITVGCIIHFSNKITNEDIGYVISSIYVKFLHEYKNIEIKEIENRSNKYLEFLQFFEDYQERRKIDIEERKKLGEHPIEIENDAERMQADLCIAFAEYYTDKIIGEQKAEIKRGMNFAAFKFAMSLIKSDIVKTTLKEFSIAFNK